VLISFLVAMVLPAFVSATAIGLSQAVETRTRLTRGDRPWVGPAIGLGYIAGHGAFARPPFPPVDVTDRIPWIALVAILLAIAEALELPGLRLRLFGRSLLLILIVCAMLGPVISTSDLEWTTSCRLSAAVAAVFMAWLNLWAMESASQGCDAYRALMLTSGAAVLVLLLSGSLVLCMLCVALTISLAAARIATWRCASDGGIIVGGAVLTALLIDGFTYANVPWRSALLLAAAPAGAWIARLGALGRKLGISAPILSASAVLALLGLAIGWAAASSQFE
jgi:hypothetical protein